LDANLLARDSDCDAQLSARARFFTSHFSTSGLVTRVFSRTLARAFFIRIKLSLVFVVYITIHPDNVTPNRTSDQQQQQQQHVFRTNAPWSTYRTNNIEYVPDEQ
jgi:hypothetical protein